MGGLWGLIGNFRHKMSGLTPEGCEWDGGVAAYGPGVVAFERPVEAGRFVLEVSA